MAEQNDLPNWYELYSFGFSVFPVPRGSKRSVVRWNKYRVERASQNELSVWCNCVSNAAIATGEISGVIVLDTDSDEADQAAKKLGVPPTPCARTGKGTHYYFEWPGHEIGNFAGKLPGCDLRGDGGYVLAPGSLHPNGEIYRWLVSPNDVPFAPAPQWLLDLASKPVPPYPPPAAPLMPIPHVEISDAYVQAAFDGELERLRNAAVGQRNNTLNLCSFALGQLVGAGVLGEHEVEQCLYQTAREIGLTHKETIDSLRSGLNAGKLKPRELPETTTLPAVVEPMQITVGQLYKVPAEATSEPVQPDLTPMPTSGFTGALGELIEQIELTNFSPQPELAVGAALCALGTLMGRKYRTESNVRTNMYIIGVGESASGKNHAPDEIARLFELAEISHYIGAERIASSSGLFCALQEQPSLMFVLDEFGHMLSRIGSDRAPEHVKDIMHQLTILYTHSHSVHKGTAYSTRGGAKGAEKINQPCLSIYGMTTEEQLWRAFGSAELVDGSIARMLFIRSSNNHPDTNWGAKQGTNPQQLLQKLCVIEQGIDLRKKHGNLTGFGGSKKEIACEQYIVPETHQATERLRSYGDANVVLARSGHRFGPILKRLYVHAVKIALIQAVSDRPAQPQIELRHVDTAIQLVEHCSQTMIRDIERHVADNNTEANHKRVLDIVRRAGQSGLTGNEFSRRTQFLNRRERADILQSLEDSGQVQRLATGSGPRKGYVIRVAP